jgi:hypothetical protein
VYNTPALGGRSSDNLQQPDTKTISVSLWSEATVHSGIMHAIQGKHIPAWEKTLSEKQFGTKMDAHHLQK